MLLDGKEALRSLMLDEKQAKAEVMVTREEYHQLIYFKQLIMSGIERDLNVRDDGDAFMLVSISPEVAEYMFPEEYHLRVEALKIERSAKECE